MNKLNRNILYKLLSILLLLASCRKDRFETFEAYPASVDELTLLLSQVERSTLPSTFVLQNNGSVIPDTVLTTVEGVRVFVTDSETLFANEDGTPLALSEVQQLEITLAPVLTVADLLAYTLSSRSADGQILSHLGTVRIEIKSNGKKLALRNDRQLRVQLPAQQLPMSTTATASHLDTDLKWAAMPNSTEVYASLWPHQNVELSGYELYATRLGWVAATQPIPANSTLSQFCLKVPQQFDAANMQAFVRLDNHTALVPLSSVSNGQFCADFLPSNQPATVFCFAKAGPNYWMASKTITLSNDVSTTTLDPQKAQYQDILAFAAQL
jgi:hypothetical protein